MKHLFIRPHYRVDKFFVVDSTELMRVKQTEYDAKFCCTCGKLYIIYNNTHNTEYLLCLVNDKLNQK